MYFRLYGASIIQFYNYCDVSRVFTNRFPSLTVATSLTQNFWKRDKWPVKAVVCLTALLDSAHLVVLVQPAYTYLVSDFGNFAALEMNSL